MNLLHEFWDVGEAMDFGPPPNLGKASTARMMQALLRLHGKLHDAAIFGDDSEPDGRRSVVYRISLPLGSQEAFEEMSGYELTRPADIRGQ